MTRRSRSRIAGPVSNFLLNLAALGGVLCIALVVAAFAFDLTLIMFKTGSMGPGIPAGSVAVVRSLPASEVRVGDVVTVDRTGLLPITHRVTSIAAGDTDVTRLITMKGDANSVEDPAPYLVSRVGLLVVAVPGLAAWIIWLSNPWVLGALALGTSTIVTWAFWPRPEDEREPRDVPKQTKRRRHRVSGAPASASRLSLWALILPLTLGVSVILAPQPARADTVEQVLTSVQLSLTLIGDESAMTNLVPGEAVPWQVGVTVADAADVEPGEVTVYLSGNGSAELQLNYTVRECAERWIDAACATGDTLLRGPEPVSLDGMEQELTTLPSTEERWLLFELWRSPNAPAATGSEAVSLQIEAFGFGDTVTAPPGRMGTIASTGTSPLPALWLAFGSLALGFAVAGAAHLRRRAAGVRR